MPEVAPFEHPDAEALYTELVKPQLDVILSKASTSITRHWETVHMEIAVDTYEGQEELLEHAREWFKDKETITIEDVENQMKLTTKMCLGVVENWLPVVEEPRRVTDIYFDMINS